MPEASDVSVLTSADVQTGALLWVCPELGHDLPPVQIQQRWRCLRIGFPTPVLARRSLSHRAPLTQIL